MEYGWGALVWMWNDRVVGGGYFPSVSTVSVWRMTIYSNRLPQVRMDS